jgi:hypothetical protein
MCILRRDHTNSIGRSSEKATMFHILRSTIYFYMPIRCTEQGYPSEISDRCLTNNVIFCSLFYLSRLFERTWILGGCCSEAQTNYLQPLVVALYPELANVFYVDLLRVFPTKNLATRITTHTVIVRRFMINHNMGN